MSTFERIIVESKGAVGVITLNRPKMLNALSFGVFREIAAIDDLEADDKIGCILLAGGEKAFAAGADIKEKSAAQDLHRHVLQRFHHHRR
jgi:enoyl-CoA hydratase